MFEIRELAWPIVQAPMAGGISTPKLAAAVSEAGGLGFLAAGYREPEAVAAEVAGLRGLTERPFGLNIFAAGGGPADPAAVEAYAARIGVEGELGEPRHDDDHFDAKLALAAELSIPVVSFTFGAPTAAQVEALHGAGCAVWVTVTTPAEAEEACAVVPDALVLQGSEAGGHRGSFDDLAPQDLGLLTLLRLVAGITDVPLIASGGLFDGAGIAAVLIAGAAAAQLGTAFMLCPEAATSPAHRRTRPRCRQPLHAGPPRGRPFRLPRDPPPDRADARRRQGRERPRPPPPLGRPSPLPVPRHLRLRAGRRPRI
jgi:nitronate monooxygenase